MPTLLDFRRRIRTVKNTQQITRAMKFVAAARLRRAQERALAARPYAQQMARVLRSTMARIEEPVHPLLARRPEEKLLVLVVTGERGLCGAFNTNVLRKAAELFRQTGRNQVSVLPIGKKGRDALRKQGRALAGEYTNVLARVRYEDARRIATQVIDLYAKAEVDAVYVVFSEFKNVLTPHLVAEKILPVEAIREAEESSAEAEMVQVDYIYEQPAGELLDRILPRYVETQVYRIMLESSAAEHAARMAAMESATQNAGEVIERLTLHMNKVRQAAITREIIEVVSGAASAG
jgi:F-type H+-transporting ATPase subunit gamma